MTQTPQVINSILLLLLLSFSVACVSGHCYDRRSKLSPHMQEVKTQILSPKREVSTAPSHVLVYKYNGSKQCGEGQTVTLKKMLTELEGIEVFSSQVKNDGLMHILVCGGESGDANVFEIDKKDLAKAERRGYKVWRFK